MGLEKAFVKEIIDELPQAKPAYNTVSTIVRILEAKGFVEHLAFGESSVLGKEQYKSFATENLLSGYFENSAESMFSFFVKKEKINMKEPRDSIVKHEHVN